MTTEPATPSPATPPVDPATPPVDTPPVDTPPVDTPPVDVASPDTPPADPASTPPPEPTADPAEAPGERVVPAADGYTLPEGVSPALGQFANENDMTQAQLDKTIEMFGQVSTANDTAQKATITKAGNALVDSWGESKEYNLSLAKRALAQNDPEGQLVNVLKASGYDNHPAVINFMYTIGQGMQEGGFLKGEVHRPAGQKSLASAMYGESHPVAGNN